jgi:hypothetical protein
MIIVPEKKSTKWHRNLSVTKTIIEGSLEVKLPTIWTVEKQR